MKTNLFGNVILTIVFGILLSGCDQQPSPTPFFQTETPTKTGYMLSVDETVTSIYQMAQQYVVFKQNDPGKWVTYAAKGPYSTPGLNLTNYSSVAITPDGSIWAGGGVEISKFDGRNWTTYPIPGELLPTESDHQLSAIAVAPDNSVWLGGKNDSLYRFDGSTWHKELDKVVIDAIAVSQNGTVWLAVQPDRTDGYIGSFYMPNGGVLEYNGQNWIPYITDNGLISDQVSGIAIAANGMVWFAAEDGISSFDGRKWNNYPMALFCTDPLCYASLQNRIAIGPDGTVWVTVEYVGMFHYDFIHWTEYENKPIFRSDSPIQNLCFSPNGNLWIGKWSIADVPLSYFDGHTWFVPYIFSNDQGITFPYSGINDIKCAGDGSIWIASAREGIIHYFP